jgi:hypothetical protein
MLARHYILWWRGPYPHHVASSSDAREDKRLARDDGTGIDPVAERDRVDPHTGIGPSGRSFRDGPHGVAGAHDVDLLPPLGGAHPHVRRLLVAAEGSGHRSAEDDPDRDADHGGGDPTATANTRSTHALMMSEHTFGVKGPLEHMFASPLDGC